MPNHSGTLRISARQLFWCPPERDLVASFKLLRPPGFGLMSRGEWWDLCPGPETPLQAGEWQTELPPDAVERIQEKTESADPLFEDKIDLLPSLVRARYKPTGEIYETVFEACYGSICDNLNSILIEWALIGIPPGEFDARERHHKEYLTAQAEERMKVCMEDLEPLHHEIFEKIRRFLASGHALRSLNQAMFDAHTEFRSRTLAGVAPEHVDLSAALAAPATAASEVVAAHSLWHQSSETAASFASVQIQAPEAPGRKLSAEEDALLAEPRGPCKKRRGAPVKMSIELKNAALAAKDGGGTNKGVAKILYNTSYPTAQQVRNAAKHISLLRKKRMDGASRVPTRTE